MNNYANCPYCGLKQAVHRMYEFAYCVPCEKEFFVTTDWKTEKVPNLSEKRKRFNRVFWNLRRILCYFFRIPIGLRDALGREICAGDWIMEKLCEPRIVKRDDAEVLGYRYKKRLCYWVSETFDGGFASDFTKEMQSHLLRLNRAPFKEYMTLKA